VTNSAANRPGRLALSDAMMASITAFLRAGDPNTPELGAHWAPWPSKIIFDASPDAARIQTQ
jgi:para-nitrobenzyl esterase